MISAALDMLSWLADHWQSITVIAAAIYGFEKYRGQRLTNKKLTRENEKLDLENDKLQLERDAVNLTLTQKERREIAEKITGAPLTDPSPNSFRKHIEHWAQARLQADVESYRSIYPPGIGPKDIIGYVYLDTPDTELGTKYQRISAAYRKNDRTWVVGATLFRESTAFEPTKMILPYRPRSLDGTDHLVTIQIA